MTDLTITDGIKQTVITRLATINSAISILNLTNGKPAKVTIEEVLDLAERIERWAWRDLLSEEKTTARDTVQTAHDTPPTSPAPPEMLVKAQPEPATEKKDDRPQPNGQGQRAGEASEKQINAIFGIGKSKGYSSQDIKTLVKKKFGKDIDQLTSREASTIIGDLQAL